MKYERFEDLPVWKTAIELAVEIFSLTENEGFKGKGDIRNQLERAVVSISNNIAEGFERGTTQELLTFVYIARGSAGEVRSMLHLIGRLPAFSNLNAPIPSLRARAESISRQLRGWTESLQNSDIKGQRYLNDKTRREEQRKKERAETDEEWNKLREEVQARIKTDYEQRIRQSSLNERVGLHRSPLFVQIPNFKSQNLKFYQEGV